MAGKTREIRSRIKAVANIKRITHTMQMIATARFQASQRRATAAQPYTRKIAELVGELAKAATASDGASQGGMSHPLLCTPETETGKELVLVISSNRGLCGGYNGNILRKAMIHLKQADVDGKQVELQVVGRKGSGFFKFNGMPVSEHHTQFGDSAQFDDVQALAEHYMTAFSTGEYDKVSVIYMAFETMSRQSVCVLPLLPMQDPTADVKPEETASTAQVDYEFSPDPQELLAELLPVTVKAQLFQCFNEAEVSEHIARMIAMKAATDNASQMGKDLTRVYNRARQGAITTELTEMISGAMALA